MCFSSATLKTAVLGSLVLLAAAGCGKKGDPLPPLSRVPLKTQDLNVRQQGRLILLDMGYPSTTVSGLALGGVDAVELLELVRPALPDGALPQVEAREFELGARTLLTLRGAELASSVTGDRIQLRIALADELPEEPVANFFGVRTSKEDDVSAVSNLVALVPIEPPEPPRGLELEAKPGSIEVRWQIDEDDASELEGFDVFRREAQERGYGKAIGRVAADQRQIDDRGARYGHRYIYTVCAVASAEPLIQSAEAGEREIEYVDRFAPPLPKNFVALAERAAIRLRWDPSPAPDVAGYILYRREPGRDFHRITEDPISATEYVNADLTSGFSYSFRIQVVDREGNESRLSVPVTTTAR